MIRRAGRLGRAALSLLMVLGILGGSLGSVPDRVAPPGQTLDSSREAEARAYAADYHVGLWEAAYRLDAQPAVEEYVAQMSEKCGGRLAGIAIRHSPDLHVELVLTGRLDRDLVRAVRATAPVRVDVVGEARWSRADLRAWVAQRLADWRARYPDLQDVVPQAATGRLAFAFADPGSQATQPRLTEADVSALRAVGLQPHVELRPAATDTFRGGLATRVCTTAVAVRDTEGRSGFLTAAHCGDQQQYYDAPAAGAPSVAQPHAAILEAAVHDSRADIEWFSTAGRTAEPFFYGTSRTTPTPVLGTGRAVEGSYLCHSGQSTGFSCGTVTSIAYRPTYTDACNGERCQDAFVAVAGGHLANGEGDSGGPWFLGGTVYGVHKGGGPGVSVYSTIDNRPSGLSVLTD